MNAATCSALWCVLTRNGPHPAALRRASQMPSKGWPWIGTRHLGRSSVNGRSRVPNPAASSSAFISPVPLSTAQFLQQFQQFLGAYRGIADSPDLDGGGQRAQISRLPDRTAGCQGQRAGNQKTVARTGNVPWCSIQCVQSVGQSAARFVGGENQHPFLAQFQQDVSRAGLLPNLLGQYNQAVLMVAGG